MSECTGMAFPNLFEGIKFKNKAQKKIIIISNSSVSKFREFAKLVNFIQPSL